MKENKKYNPPVKTDLSFEEAVNVIASAPKEVVEKKINQEKKRRKRASK